MRKFRGLAITLLLFAITRADTLAGAAPTIDRAKLEAYLRYAEGFMANVHFAVDEPASTAFPNFYKVKVHLTTDSGAKLDRTYFMTPDGQQIINGTIWDLNSSPFAETLSHMPAGGYSFGPADAKVQLVIFSDFQCPYCREFAKTVRDNIPKKYPKDVRVIFEDFPLDAIHPWARAAAEASHCVGDQSQEEFWTFHDWVFGQASEIKSENLKDKILAWAKDQKVDSSKLQTCMDTHAEADAVKQETASAKTLQVEQTPTSFANGRLIPGALPWSSLDSVIAIELKRPSAGQVIR